jgi:transcription-repair coupling factor (superfamily II helicase)
LAKRSGVEAVERRQGVVNMKFHQESRIDPARLMEMVQQSPGAQFTPAGVLRLPVDGTARPAELLGYLKEKMLQLTV